jgi:predicted RNase H-like nuclease (RuvC/YqgF family)
MKRGNFKQHIILENMYLKHKHNEFVQRNEQLQNELMILNCKMNDMYRNHANTIVILQDKNNSLKKTLNEKDKYIQYILNRKTFSIDNLELFHISFPNPNSESTSEESIESNITFDSTLTHS